MESIIGRSGGLSQIPVPRHAVLQKQLRGAGDMHSRNRTMFRSPQEGIQSMALPVLGTNYLYPDGSNQKLSNSEGSTSPQQKANQQYLDPYYVGGGLGQGGSFPVGKDVQVFSGSPIPITAAGFPPNHHKIKKYSRETNYESDYSIVETEAAFPQQPSSGETMDYRYKKSNMGRITQQIQIQPQFQQTVNSQGQMVYAPVLIPQITDPPQKAHPLKYQNINDSQQQTDRQQQYWSQQPPVRQQPQLKQQHSQQPQRPRAGTTLNNYSNNGAYNSNPPGGQQYPETAFIQNPIENLPLPLPPQPVRPGQILNDQPYPVAPPAPVPQAPTNQRRISRNQGQVKHFQTVENLPVESRRTSVQQQRLSSGGTGAGTGRNNPRQQKRIEENKQNANKAAPNVPRRSSVGAPETSQGSESPSPLKQINPNGKVGQERAQSFTQQALLVKREASLGSNKSKVPVSQTPKNEPVKKIQEKRTSVKLADLKFSLTGPQEPIFEQNLENATKIFEPKIEEAKQESSPKPFLSSLFKKLASANGGDQEKEKKKPLSLLSKEEILSQKAPELKAHKTLRFEQEMKMIEEENPASLMRIDNEKDSGDLVMLIQAHRQIVKDAAPGGKKPAFRKHRNDIVMRQLKFVHESSLVDERRQFQQENENGRLLDEPQRRQQLERLESLNLQCSQLLRVVPVPIQIKVNEKFPSLPFNQRPTLSFIEATQKCHVVNKEIKWQIVKRASSFPRKTRNDKAIRGAAKILNNQYFPRQNKLGNLLSKLGSSAFIDEGRGDQIYQASNAILRRRNSYGHHEMLARKDVTVVEGFSLTTNEMYPQRSMDQIKHIQVEDIDFNYITIKDGDAVIGENGASRPTIVNMGIPVLNFSHDNGGSMNRIDEGSSSVPSSLEELDEFHDSMIQPQKQMKKVMHQNSGKPQQPNNQMNRKESLHLQSQQTQYKRRGTITAINFQQPRNSKKHPVRGQSSKNLGGNPDGVSHPRTPGFHYTVNNYTKEPYGESSNEHNNEQNLVGHVMTKEQLENFEVKVLEKVQSAEAAKQLSDPKSPGVLPPSRRESAYFQAKNDDKNTLKVGMLQPTNALLTPKKQLITNEEERSLLRASLGDQKNLRFQRYFILPRDNFLIMMNELGINKMAMSPSPLLSTGTRLDYSGQKNLQTAKKLLIKTNSNIVPGTVTDYALQELRNIEKVQLFVYPKRYDILSDPLIYIKESYLADPFEGSRTTINFQIVNPIIIKLRGIKPDEEEIYENGNISSTVIMEFLRERYLSNFSKYSRHLTQNQRPTSRYYNTHQVKDLAALSATGGFSKEHHALPKWKIQNNQELLHFQVAQLRKAYSNWLLRQSMNEDIKNTLFQKKTDLLLMNVKTAINANLCSPTLVEVTIDKICQLCLKPEDLYKLNFVFNKGGLGNDKKNKNGTFGNATTGGEVKTIGSTLDRSHNDSFYQSAQDTTSGQGMDETIADYDEMTDDMTAIYLHNHPLFITYNQDLEKADISIDSFIPSRFRLSTLFGYKSKMVKDGLYEVFAPIPDARYILCIAFKRAFMVKREQRLSLLAKQQQLQSAIQEKKLS